MTSMSIDVADVRHGAGNGREVSGSAVHVLMGMVSAHSGESGVAQALALAGEHRPFTHLADPDRWSSLPQTVALFNAAALVTGDGAVGLHVGEVLLFTPDVADFTERLRSLGSSHEILKHIEPVIEQFETTSSATSLRVAADHALVEVTPRHGHSRHAHLCEMTRGILAQIPTLFDGEPAIITEAECSARGGRRCLYALSWDASRADTMAADDETEGTPSRHARARRGGVYGNRP